MTTEDTKRTDFRGQLSFTPEGPADAEQILKTSEGRLLWAVLENGIDQYMKHATTTGRRGGRLFREAEEWIMRDDLTWLCSFVNICNVLGLDPTYLRTGLQRWREAQAYPAFRQAA